MFLSLFAKYASAVFLFQLMCVSYIDIAITTSGRNRPLVKLVFILEETQRDDLKSAFDFLLKETVNSSVFNVEGITLEWKTKETPNSTWSKIKANIIMENASAVVSFLPSWKNQVLVNALSKIDVPVIGMESLTGELYTSKKVGKHVLKQKHLISFAFWRTVKRVSTR